MSRSSEIIENQRYWGLTWGSPLLPFDWPPWSNAAGEPVSMPRFPTLDGERGWYIVRSASTDEDGWQYSTTYARLSMPRPGGRASKRGSDQVRSRVWRHLEHVDQDMLPIMADAAVRLQRAQAQQTGHLVTAPQHPGGVLPHPPPSQAVGAFPVPSGEAPKPSLLKLWQALYELWNDSCARHGMSKVLPLDPMGLYLAAREHRGNLDGHRRAQLRAHKLIAATHAPDKTSGPLQFSPPPLPPPTAAAARAAAAIVAASAAVPSISQEVEGVPVHVTSPCLHRSSNGGSGGITSGVRSTSARGVACAGPATACSLGPHPFQHALKSSSGDGRHCTHNCQSHSLEGASTTADKKMQTDGQRRHWQTFGMWPGTQRLLPHQQHDHPYRATGGPQEKYYLINEMLNATDYARGAYGYVMTAGYLTSFSKMIGMASMSAYFDPVSGASIEANNEAIHVLTGIPPKDIFLSEWRSTIFRPCHYLAVDKARRQLVISIRGSLEMGDITTDITAAPLEMRFGELQGHVHQGLMSAAMYIHFNTSDALQQAVDEYPGWPMLVTGHSLGGGVAALLALLLRQPGTAPAAMGPVRSVGVAPAAVMDGLLADSCRDYEISVVLNSDFVPRLSFFSVERALIDLVRLSPAHQMTNTLIQSTAETWQAISAGLSRVRNVSAVLGQDDNEAEAELQKQVEVELAERRQQRQQEQVARKQRQCTGAHGGHGVRTHSASDLRAALGNNSSVALDNDAALTWEGLKSSLITTIFGDEVSEDAPQSPTPDATDMDCDAVLVSPLVRESASQQRPNAATQGVPSGMPRVCTTGSNGGQGSSHTASVGGTATLSCMERAPGGSRATHAERGTSPGKAAAAGMSQAGRDKATAASTAAAAATAPPLLAAAAKVGANMSPATAAGSGAPPSAPAAATAAALPDPVSAARELQKQQDRKRGGHRHTAPGPAVHRAPADGETDHAAAASAAAAAIMSGQAVREGARPGADASDSWHDFPSGNAPGPDRMASRSTSPRAGPAHKSKHSHSPRHASCTGKVQQPTAGRAAGAGPDEASVQDGRGTVACASGEEEVGRVAAVAAVGVTQGPVELYPAGRILWIVFDGEGAIGQECMSNVPSANTAHEQQKQRRGSAKLASDNTAKAETVTLESSSPASAPAEMGKGPDEGSLLTKLLQQPLTDLLPQPLVDLLSPSASTSALPAPGNLSGLAPSASLCSVSESQLLRQDVSPAAALIRTDDCRQVSMPPGSAHAGSGLRAPPLAAAEPRLPNATGALMDVAAADSRLLPSATLSSAQPGLEVHPQTLQQKPFGPSQVQAAVARPDEALANNATNLTQKFTNGWRKIKDNVMNKAALLGVVNENDGTGGGGRRFVYLLDADKECFNTLVLVPSCVAEHIPDEYLRALKQLEAGVGELPTFASDEIEPGSSVHAACGNDSGNVGSKNTGLAAQLGSIKAQPSPQSSSADQVTEACTAIRADSAWQLPMRSDGSLEWAFEAEKLPDASLAAAQNG